MWVLPLLVASLSLPLAAQDSGAPLFEIAASNILDKGQGEYQQLKAHAKEERVLDYILGTDCYSQAVLKLDRECRKLNDAERARLAVAMANCLLAQSGQPTHKCTPTMTVKDCTVGMDDRAFAAYNSFFTNIHSMCLFLQNQEFMRQAEALVNQLHSGSREAARQLLHISSNLTAQQQQLGGMGEVLGQLGHEQKALRAGLQEGLQALKGLHESSGQLERDMARHLEVQEMLGQEQQRVLGGLQELEDAERRRAQEAAERWQEVGQKAEDMQRRQAAYEQTQETILRSAEMLAERTDAVKGTVDLLLRYEQKSSAILRYLLGRAFSLQDMLFYFLTAASAMLLTTTATTAPARLPLLVGLAACISLERLALGWLHTNLGLTETGSKVVWELPFTVLGFGAIDYRCLLRQVVLATAMAVGAWRAVHCRGQQQADFAAAAAAAVHDLEQKLMEINHNLRNIQHFYEPRFAAAPPGGHAPGSRSAPGGPQAGSNSRGPTTGGPTSGPPQAAAPEAFNPQKTSKRSTQAAPSHPASQAQPAFHCDQHRQHHLGLDLEPVHGGHPLLANAWHVEAAPLLLPLPCFNGATLPEAALPHPLHPASTQSDQAHLVHHRQGYPATPLPPTPIWAAQQAPTTLHDSTTQHTHSEYQSPKQPTYAMPEGPAAAAAAAAGGEQDLQQQQLPSSHTDAYGAAGQMLVAGLAHAGGSGSESPRSASSGWGGRQQRRGKRRGPEPLTADSLEAERAQMPASGHEGDPGANKRRHLSNN